MQNTRSGGQLLVQELQTHGVQHVFCVPGESFLAVLDALHDAPDIAVTVCRQEGGAAMMAEAQGKLSGRPGICMVTRGPGATNASAGIHIAMQDATPLILFVGQIERGMREREAFQELDYRAVFGKQAKWVTEIDAAARIPELLSRAFHIATSGRPGPVVIALPEDMLSEGVAVPAPAEVALRSGAAAPVLAGASASVPSGRTRSRRGFCAVEASPSRAQMQALAALLAQAQKPFFILGGSRWSAEACAQFEAFASAWQLPVACSFRRQMLFAGEHACYAGDVGLGINPQLLARLRAADLIVLLGGRLSEVPSQSYTLLQIPRPQQTLVHIYPDPDELNHVYQADLCIAASPQGLVPELAALTPPAAPVWAEQTRAAHADYLAWSDPAGRSNPGALQMGPVMQHLRGALAQDVILCNGAGNFSIWLHRFWRHRGYGTQLAPTSGSMGYGLPAAVGAQRLYPERCVVCFAGDGDFMMHGQELATAVQYNLPIIVVLLDNGMYGTIRMHQEKNYPARVFATDLKNPDFCALAFAYGAHGERVERTEEFAPALARALASGKPAVLHCLLDPQAITPAATLDSLRAKGLAQQAAG
jgi:acetolactate synthase I/II/III large subunit